MANANEGKKTHWTVARHVVQVLMLVLFALPMIVAGWGLAGGFASSDDALATPAELVFFGTLSSSKIGPLTLLDPFAVLQVVAASKSFALEWLVGLLPVLVVYGLVRGRAFCGWTCPVNLLLEIVDFLRGKLGISVEERVLPRHVKLYVALGVLVLSAIVGVPVFEAISPLSFINKGIVLGSMTGGITLVAIILAELFWGHRVWCRSICPLGGFYEAVGKVGLVNVKIDHDTCIGCNKCKKACLCDPIILEPAIEGRASAVLAGDCMACGKCVDACPTSSLRLGIGRGSEAAQSATIGEADS